MTIKDNPWSTLYTIYFVHTPQAVLFLTAETDLNEIFVEAKSMDIPVEVNKTKEIAVFIYPKNFPNYVLDKAAQDSVLETLSDAVDKGLDPPIHLSKTICLDGMSN